MVIYAAIIFTAIFIYFVGNFISYLIINGAERVKWGNVLGLSLFYIMALLILWNKKGGN